MRWAIFSDVHGNLAALEAVLKDADRRSVDAFYCLGDMVGVGPHGSEVVDLCRARCRGIIAGNWERSILALDTQDPQRLAENRWHFEQLGPQRREFIGALPTALELALGDTRIGLLHGRHRVPLIFQDAPQAQLEQVFNSVYEGAADVVGYGDIHRPFMRTLEGRRPRTLFNTGSVGWSMDGDWRAKYALLSVEQDGGFSIEFRRVAYDVQRALRDAQMLPEGLGKERFTYAIQHGVGRRLRTPL